MDAGRDQESLPLCPSARPEMEGSVVFGVVGGTARAPRVGYLARPLPVTDGLLAMAAPASPMSVFRTAAPCAGSACSHFADGDCRLVTRIVSELPLAVVHVPPCQIRPSCRWWRQEGVAACRRCPMIVSETANWTEDLRAATDPTVYATDGSWPVQEHAS